MGDEQVQPTDGAVESEPVESLTEDKVKTMLEERDRTWQSRFDKLLKEKKETETKSKTAEERIAEIERRWEEERLGRARERVLHETKLDASIMDAMQAFLGNDEEGIKSGASQVSQYIQAKIEAGVKAGVDEEIKRRFPENAPKPQGGKPGAEMSREEFLMLTEEQLQSLGAQKVTELTRQFSKR